MEFSQPLWNPCFEESQEEASSQLWDFPSKRQAFRSYQETDDEASDEDIFKEQAFYSYQQTDEEDSDEESDDESVKPWTHRRQAFCAHQGIDEDFDEESDKSRVKPLEEEDEVATVVPSDEEDEEDEVDTVVPSDEEDEEDAVVPSDEESERRSSTPFLSQATGIIRRCWKKGAINQKSEGIVYGGVVQVDAVKASNTGARKTGIKGNQKKKATTKKAATKKAATKKATAKKATVKKAPRQPPPKNFQGFPMKYCKYIDRRVGTVFIPYLRKGPEEEYGLKWRDGRTGDMVYFEEKHFCHDCLLMPCVMVEKHCLIYELINRWEKEGASYTTMKNKLSEHLLNVVLPQIFNKTYVKRVGLPSCITKWIESVLNPKPKLSFSQAFELGNQLLEEDDSDLES